MNIELIAIDIDGTLLTPEKVISQKVKETLARAKSQGIKVVLCTGRPLPGVLAYLKELNLEEKGDYAITYNGALVQETNSGEVLANHTMSFDDFLEVEAMSRQVGVHLHTTAKKAMYTANKDISPYTVRESFLVNLPLKYRTVEEMDKDVIISKMMMIDEPEILDKGIAQIPAAFMEKYTVLKSEPYYLEVLNKKASKGQALNDLANLLSIPRENVMALGDNENDRDMLEYAGFGVAMGNAVPSVKEASDYVTDSNAADGVATAIERFALKK